MLVEVPLFSVGKTTGSVADITRSVMLVLLPLVLVEHHVDVNA